MGQLTKADMRSILTEVKKNLRRLNGCPGPHEFELIEAIGGFRKKYRCKICGGDIDGIQYHWYEKGLAHGKMNHAE